MFILMQLILIVIAWIHTWVSYRLPVGQEKVKL